MSTRILAAASPGEVRVAVAAGESLIDYAIWRPGAPDGVGDLHKGRVRTRAPALAGAFVALVDGPDGFLPDSEGGAKVPEGSLLGVRVTRAAQGGKGPRLTTRLTAAERGRAETAASPALLRRGPGALVRLACFHPGAPVLTDDPALTAMLRPILGGPISTVPRVLDEALEDAVAALAESSIALPGGGTMTITPTPALIAIDMDTGRASAARDGKAAAQVAFNRAALPVLARQIRLRNLSGAILVDFAGLPARRRATLAPELVAVLASDPLAPRLLGFTALGLAEIVRARVHAPLHELLSGPHAAGLAALRAAMHRAAADPATSLALRAAPGVIAALDADRAACADLARRAGRPLILRSDPALAGDGWMLEAA